MLRETEANETRIGNYRVIDILGKGGYCIVYLGEHCIFNYRVALKVLHRNLTSEREHLLFFREAHILNELRHPHILPILDAGIDHGLPYLVVEYMPCGSLQERLNHHSPSLIPLKDAISILSQIGQALHHAHQHHVIHRDLKPANILFNAKGAALLADFGIAAILDKGNMRQESRVRGTFLYMAPEQFLGTLRKESDQYALGCLAYRLLTGKEPFSATSFRTLMQQHLYEYPITPTRLNPSLTAATEYCLLKAMAKQPEDRYPSVIAFLAALRSSALQIETSTSVPGMHTRWLAESDLSFSPKRYHQASTPYKKVLQQNHKRALAYYKNGIALYHQRRYRVALLYFEQTIKLQPENVSAYVGKAHTLLALGCYEKALEAFDIILEKDSTIPAAHYYRGFVLERLKRHEEAKRAYKKAQYYDFKK